MSDQRNGGISWTDETWNPVRGCSRVSSGCTRCYAERVAARFSGHGQPYEGLAHMTPPGPRWTGQVRLIEDHLLDPLRWRRPRRVFVNSMSDLFHEGLPDEAIDRLFAVMALADRHQFQVLTKRPERMAAYFADLRTRTRAVVDHMADIRYMGFEPDAVSLPLRNVWLGVSVEDQATADERIPLLLQTPAAVRFVSAEPLLAPVQLAWNWVSRGRPLGGGPRCNLSEPWAEPAPTRALDWVIVGGESGPGARPMHPEWARSLRDQCQAAGVAYFFKQHGQWVSSGHPQFGRLPQREMCWLKTSGERWPAPQEDENADCLAMKRVGKRAAGDLLDGQQWHQFPEASR